MQELGLYLSALVMNNRLRIIKLDSRWQANKINEASFSLKRVYRSSEERPEHESQTDFCPPNPNWTDCP